MIFIDTGAFISKYIERDQYHVSSVSFWREITETRERLFTSNFVIDETLTLLGRRTSYGFSAERALKIYDSNHLTILRPDRFDELEAIKLFLKFSDQKMSFTDCISAILMNRQKIQRCFTHDDHFRLMGFQVFPVR